MVIRRGREAKTLQITMLHFASCSGVSGCYQEILLKPISDTGQTSRGDQVHETRKTKYEHMVDYSIEFYETGIPADERQRTAGKVPRMTRLIQSPSTSSLFVQSPSTYLHYSTSYFTGRNGKECRHGLHHSFAPTISAHLWVEKDFGRSMGAPIARSMIS